MPRRFPPPWSIEERQESFIVKDANGQHLAYLYFEDEPQRQLSTKRLSPDEAFLVAVNIAKLPSVPRQILKDITRPPIRPAGTIERDTDRQGDNMRERTLHRWRFGRPMLHCRPSPLLAGNPQPGFFPIMP
jgi:hypothetical protein